MTEHDTNLRDLAAMFAMSGLLMSMYEERGVRIVDEAFKYADEFMERRQPQVEEGIAALKPKARAKK
jgi:hypothetical protein